MLQARGRSASIASSDIVGCSAKRRGGLVAAGQASLLRGRPRFWRLAGFACRTSRGGRSRAGMALLSRAMWPISRAAWLASITAACARSGNVDAANAANARLNVASLGNSPTRSQPQSRRNRRSMRSRSTRRVVVAISNTTFATNARASDTRHANGRPTRPNERGTNRSSRAISKTVTKPKGNLSYWSAFRSQDTRAWSRSAPGRRAMRRRSRTASHRRSAGRDAGRGTGRRAGRASPGRHRPRSASRSPA
jgi:hypothetical protein